MDCDTSPDAVHSFLGPGCRVSSSHLVHQQLNYSGVLEVVRIRREVRGCGFVWMMYCCRVVSPPRAAIFSPAGHPLPKECQVCSKSSAFVVVVACPGLLARLGFCRPFVLVLYRRSVCWFCLGFVPLQGTKCARESIHCCIASQHESR